MIESTHKTKIDIGKVKTFLENFYKSEVSDITFISGGESSQAYSYSIDDKDFVIRFNKNNILGFQKDQFAYENFASENLPIPKVFSIGTTDEGIFYCISEKVQGDLVVDVSIEIREKILPNLFSVLDEIQRVNISEFKNYGKFNLSKKGNRLSWKEYLLSVDEQAKNFFYTSFLEKDVWEKIYSKYVDLVKFCPEDKFLVHGDFGGGNMMVNKGEVSGVFDWEQMMLGDFLYDVAWMSFWNDKIDYKTRYYEIYKNSDKNLENYEERILCYKLEIGLDAISFYAYSNQKEKYGEVKLRLLGLIN